MVVGGRYRGRAHINTRTQSIQHVYVSTTYTGHHATQRKRTHDDAGRRGAIVEAVGGEGALAHVLVQVFFSDRPGLE